MKEFIKKNKVTVFIIFWVVYIFIFSQVVHINENSKSEYTPQDTDCIDYGKGGWYC